MCMIPNCLWVLKVIFAIPLLNCHATCCGVDLSITSRSMRKQVTRKPIKNSRGNHGNLIYVAKPIFFRLVGKSIFFFVRLLISLRHCTCAHTGEVRRARTYSREEQRIAVAVPWHIHTWMGLPPTACCHLYLIIQPHPVCCIRHIVSTDVMLLA